MGLPKVYKQTHSANFDQFIAAVGKHKNLTIFQTQAHAYIGIRIVIANDWLDLLGNVIVILMLETHKWEKKIVSCPDTVW